MITTKLTHQCRQLALGKVLPGLAQCVDISAVAVHKVQGDRLKESTMQACVRWYQTQDKHRSHMSRCKQHHGVICCQMSAHAMTASVRSGRDNQSIKPLQIFLPAWPRLYNAHWCAGMPSIQVLCVWPAIHHTMLCQQASVPMQPIIASCHPDASCFGCDDLCIDTNKTRPE